MLALLLAPRPAAAEWHFTEVAAAAGLTYEHGFGGEPLTEAHLVSGGVAAGDLDGDGWPDLWVVRGGKGPDLFYRNRQDGTFEAVLVALPDGGGVSVGPAFADLDGDGRLDLVLGGIAGAPARTYRNLGDAGFELLEELPGGDTFSRAFGDYDRDGDLDMFVSRWGVQEFFRNHLWRNDGDGTFSPVDFAAGIAPAYQEVDWSFTPTFTDLDDDGWPDLVVAGDFGTSQVFLNRRDGSFEIVTSAVISDENGMGSAVGDYDADGDLDWFVSSIWDPDGQAEGNWGTTGNRLYRNLGDGSFEDATEEAGVSQGWWGWGACLADLDNDGHLDLFHTNGFQALQAVDFHHDPARLFVADGDGTFTERAAELGLDHTGQGRGVVCFDYDQDGDLDILVANHGGPPLLYRNEGGNQRSFLALRLRGAGGNSEAIGARVELSAGGHRQLREIRAGSNYVSQNPATLSFGLGAATAIDQLTIRWPDGEVEVIGPLAANQRLEVVQGGLPVIEIPASGRWGRLLLILIISLAGCRLLHRCG